MDTDTEATSLVPLVHCIVVFLNSVQHGSLSLVGEVVRGHGLTPFPNIGPAYYASEKREMQSALRLAIPEIALV